MVAFPRIAIPPDSRSTLHKKAPGDDLSAAVAEEERLFIEEYGHHTFLNRLRELIDDDPHGTICDGENPEAVRRGLIKKLRQKMQ